MELAGVVYHAGATTNTGHYTCLCRGPGGGFWYYDDSAPVREMKMVVGQIKPREVYMVAYCRQGGRAAWADQRPAAGDLEVPAGGPVVGRSSVSQDVDMEGSGPHSSAAGSWETAGIEAHDTQSPAMRRLRKVSVDSAADVVENEPVVRDSTLSERQAKIRRMATQEEDCVEIVCDVAGRGGVEEAGAAADASRFSLSARAGAGASREDPRAAGGRARVVTGFGVERVEDVLAHERRREVEGVRRGSQRREAGERGRARDLENRDLDRGAGGPWQAGGRR
jgi:hypothetical protein